MTERPDPGSVRANLHEATRTAWRLSEQLETYIADWGQPTLGIGGGRKKPGSTPPWNSTAADLIFSLRTLCRRLEAELRAAVTGGVRLRGFSDRNTHLSLEALNDLAVTATDSQVAFALYEINAWLEKARPVVGETEPLRRLPRLPGCGEPRCPWCAYCTLRCKPTAGMLFCINPGCLDENGRRPHGSIDVGTAVDAVVIRWQDGTFGVPQPSVQGALVGAAA